MENNLKFEPIYMEEYQAVLLEILRDIDRVCEKHNILYYMSGGTLIGAIREKGFLAWDDDLDINMPRPDYERFLRVADSELDGKYTFLSSNDKKGNFFQYKKMSKVYDTTTFIEEGSPSFKVRYGIYVDIFAVDGTPNDENLQDKHIKKIFRTREKDAFFAYQYDYNKGAKTFKGKLAYITRSFIGKIYRIILRRPYAKKLDKLLKKYDFYKSDMVGVLPWTKNHTGLFTRQAMEKVVKVEFAGEEFNAPIGYDENLTVAYGDYMTPPPKSEQVTHHNIVAYRIKEN